MDDVKIGEGKILSPGKITFAADLIITGSGGKELFIIHPDGWMELGDGVQINEVATVFLECCNEQYKQLQEENPRLKGHVIDANKGSALNSEVAHILHTTNEQLQVENKELIHDMEQLLTAVNIEANENEPLRDRG